MIDEIVVSDKAVANNVGYDASLGRSLCDTHNPTLGLFSRTI